MATWEIGEIDNSPIGQNTPAAGTFTALSATTSISSPDPIRQNLLDNSGFGVWSQSELDQGTGTGRQSDWEVGSAIHDDDCEDDDTGDYTTSDCTLTFTSSPGNGAEGSDGYYTVTQTGGTYQHVDITLSGLVADRLYKFSIYIKNGTHTFDSSDQLKTYYGAEQFIETLELDGAGDWTAASVIWRAVNTDDVVRLHVVLGSGETVLIDNWHVHEVTPGCSLSHGPDGWYTYSPVGGSNLKIRREPTDDNTKDGAYYALRMSGAVQHDRLVWPRFSALYNDPGFYKQFAGRTVTCGVWAKTSTANDLRIRIYDGVTYATSSYHSGSGNWEWIEVSKTCSVNTTKFYIGFQLANASPGTTYLSQPMLVFGNSIGEGNYCPKQGEFLPTREYIQLRSYGSGTVTANESVNLEAQSSGKIPATAKAVFATLIGSCADVEKTLALSDASPIRFEGPRIYSQAADVKTANSGIVAINNTGDVYLLRDDTFNEVTIRISGVYLW